MKTLLITLMLISFSTLAEIKERPIDLSDCIKKDCFARGAHEFKPDENIKIQAWFDIVRWEGERGTKFYPLFNIYNFTGAPSQILIGMQLLDKNKKILSEAKFSQQISPAKKNTQSKETYISLNAEPVTDETLKNTKYLKVLYEK